MEKQYTIVRVKKYGTVNRKKKKQKEREKGVYISYVAKRGRKKPKIKTKYIRNILPCG